MKNVYYVCLLILFNLNIQYCLSFHLNKSPKTTSHSFMNVHSKRIIFMSLSNSNPNNINDENAYKNSDPIVNSKSNAMTFSGNGDNQNINQNSDTFYPFPQSSTTSTGSITANNNSNNNNNNGPLQRMRKIFVLTILLIRGLFLSFFMKIKNILPKSKNTKNSKTSKMINSISENKIIVKLNESRIFQLLKSPKIQSRLVAFVLALYGLRRYNAYTRSLTLELAYSTFLKVIEADPSRIQYLKITPAAFYFKYDGKSAFTRRVLLDPLIMKRFTESGLDFTAPPAPPNVLGILWTLVYAGFMWNITTRMMQGPQDNGVGSRKDQIMEKSSLSFDDVAGQDQAKYDVYEVCKMLRDPSRYQAVGARLPAGVLLIGPPGTGKTLLARVTAAEAGVPFYSCSASDFVEVFVGRGPARVRKLFKNAATNAPCIVFIDELDSIGRSRRQGSMNSEQENTLNAILTCMDGLDTSNNGVIVMAATNRLELLDPALLRAGRFDRIIQCPLPDKNGREAILRVHCKKLSLSMDVDLARVARLTPGTSGADLSAVCNEAAIRAARRNAITINSSDFDGAIESFLSGRTAQVGSLIEGAANNLFPWLSNNNNNNNEAALGS